METPSFIEKQRALAPMTTLGVGGQAAWFTAPATEAELVAALRWAHSEGLPSHLIGGGSNVVVADAGLTALVIHPRLDALEVRPDGRDVLVTIEAGADWHQFVQATVSEGWAGVECLAGIPGLVGAAPIQNIGAYGQEVGDVTESVRVYCPKADTVLTLSRDDCGFAYRSSVFKRNIEAGRIVVSVTLRLRPGGEPTIRYGELSRRVAGTTDLGRVRDEVLALRRSKSMVVDPKDPNSRSAGSFFMNPIIDGDRLAVVEKGAERCGVDPASMPRWPTDDGRFKLAAAWLIERAGLTKGYIRGRAGLSERHTLAIINRGEASAREIVELAAQVRATVLDRFGIALVPEPVFLGFTRTTVDLLDETHRLGRMPNR